MRFLDLFAGIGGFRLGMEKAGHECVGYVEWDKFARKSYEAIHNTEGEWTAHDITKVTDEEIQSIRERNIDVICGGFPCQSFSVAGKRLGFEDTRGTMFFQIARFVKQIKPRLLLLENVKGLLSHDQGNTFGTILHTLDELGYNCEWQVLNSKNFGVPQNRERVFIVGHLRGSGGREVFPIKESDFKNDHLQGQQVYTNTVLARYGNLGQGSYIVECEQYAQNGLIPIGQLYENWNDPTSKIYSACGISPTLTTMQGGNRQPKIIQRARGNNKGNIHEIAPTLTSNSYHENNYLNDGLRIRKLTPLECWRLQGFPDWAFNEATEVNSDSQLYKQAGNSVTVNVIYEIAKRLGE